MLQAMIFGVAWFAVCIACGAWLHNVVDGADKVLNPGATAGAEPMMLYFDRTGPMVRYFNGIFTVDNLNPEVSTKWCMSRGEMLRFGWRCLVAAVRG